MDNRNIKLTGQKILAMRNRYDLTKEPLKADDVLAVLEGLFLEVERLDRQTESMPAKIVGDIADALEKGSRP